MFLFFFAVLVLYDFGTGHTTSAPIAVDLRVAGVGLGLGAIFVWVAYGYYQRDEETER